MQKSDLFVPHRSNNTWNSITTMGLTLTNAFMMCAQRPQAYGSHLAPPPRSHGVVGILFCLPVFTSGIGGFIATITNGKVTDPDMFTLHLAGVVRPPASVRRLQRAERM